MFLKYTFKVLAQRLILNTREVKVLATLQQQFKYLKAFYLTVKHIVIKIQTFLSLVKITFSQENTNFTLSEIA